MIKNLSAMPSFLKVLTLMGFGVFVWVVTTMFQSGIAVFGRQLSTSEWWTSGAGLFCSVVGLILGGASVLMLNRSYYGRPAHILGWIGVSVTVPFVTFVTKSDQSFTAQTFWSYLALTALIALYLYRNKAVQNYFRAPTNSTGS